MTRTRAAIVAVVACCAFALVFQIAHGISENNRTRERSIATIDRFYSGIRAGDPQVNVDRSASRLGLEVRGDYPLYDYHAPDWYSPPACDGTVYVRIAYRDKRVAQVSRPIEGIGPCM